MIYQKFLVLTLFLVFCPSLSAQESNLQIGPSFAVVDGQPLIQFTLENGSSTKILVKKFEGEEAFEFPVTHNVFVDDINDYLYITKSKIIYKAPTNAKKSFVLSRNEVIKAEVDKIGLLSSMSFYFFAIKYADDTKKFSIRVDPKRKGYKSAPKAQLLVYDFIKALINNFDAAAAPYLSKASNPKDLVTINGLPEEAADLVKSYSGYDRFEDLTTKSIELILTKPLDKQYQELGPVLSLIISHQFPGKTKTQTPRSIILSFRYWVFVGRNELRRSVFDNPTELILLAGDKRLKTSMGKSTFVDQLNREIEVVSVTIPFDEFVPLIETQSTVEMRIGNRELTLKKFQVDAIGDFVSEARVSSKGGH